MSLRMFVFLWCLLVGTFTLGAWSGWWWANRVPAEVVVSDIQWFDNSSGEIDANPYIFGADPGISVTCSFSATNDADRAMEVPEGMDLDVVWENWKNVRHEGWQDYQERVE